MSDPADNPKPRFTRVPNDFLDRLMRCKDMEMSELKITLAVYRKTFGYQKTEDRISISQFKEITGLSRQAIFDGIEAMLKRGAITRREDGQWFVYQVVYSIDHLGDEVVNRVDQSTQETGLLNRPEVVYSVDHLEPKVVYSVDTQKKDSKERKERESTRAPAQASLDFLHEGVTIYKRLSGKKPVPAMVKRIAETITDYAFWEMVVTNWCGKFRADNIDGMIDWYLHPEKMARSLNTSSNGHKPPDSRPALEPFTPKVRPQLSPAEMKAALEKARSS